MTPYRLPGREPDPPERHLFSRVALWPDWMVVVAIVSAAGLVALLAEGAETRPAVRARHGR